jgi:hypothetical protein
MELKIHSEFCLSYFIVLFLSKFCFPVVGASAFGQFGFPTGATSAWSSASASIRGWEQHAGPYALQCAALWLCL